MKQTVDILKALGDERRLRVAALVSDQELCVCELVGGLCEPQYSVSRALSGLRRAGLVSSRKEGKWVYYSLSDDKADVVRQLISAVRSRFRERLFEEDAERLAYRLRFRVEGKCIYGLEVGGCCKPSGVPTGVSTG